MGTKGTYTFRDFHTWKNIPGKMGLVSDQDGILRRYIKEGQNWSEHLINTKQVIIDFIKAGKVRTISVFGSGWMLDIPVQYLAGEMDKVVYYDLRHPRAIRDKYSRCSNFEFIEMDLTGGLIETVYKLCHRKSKPEFDELIHEFTSVSITLPVETGYFVSVNMLNQIDILLIDYMNKYFDFTPGELADLRRTLQTNHLGLLKPEHSCLITDIEEIHLNDQGETVAIVPLIYCELPAGYNVKTWNWQFDTRKTYHPDCMTYMKVLSMYL